MPEHLEQPARSYVEYLAEGGHCPSCQRVATLVLARDDEGTVGLRDWRWIAETAVCEVYDRENREDEAVEQDAFDPYVDDEFGETEDETDTPEEARIRELRPQGVPSAFADALGDLDTEGI